MGSALIGYNKFQEYGLRIVGARLQGPFTQRYRRGQVAEAVALIERLGGREYTRDQARRYRDEAIAELDAAGVV